VAGKVRHTVTSDVEVPPGRRSVGFEFTRTADFAGTGRLYMDDQVVGEGELPFVTPARLSITGSGLTCGYEVGPAISSDYDAPFQSAGDILKVIVDVSGQPYRDLRADVAAALASQ
jgi:arylsulfatase